MFHMMRIDAEHQGTQALDRALQFLTAILEDGGDSSLAKIGGAMGLPRATAYRLSSALVRAGYVLPGGRGRLLPGSVLTALSSKLSLRPALTIIGRPVVEALAARTKGVAHLGVLEQDMVTYLLKAGSHADVFTAEGKQLEAYCSGIGKLLLASLPPDERAAYLENGPFVALTRNTITDPTELEREFGRIRDCGFARDIEEAGPGLHCLAAPVRDETGRIVAALSVTRTQPDTDEAGTLAALRIAASDLEQRMFRRASARDSAPKAA